MSAVSEEFRSLVECGPLWTKHDEKFFFQTNPAYASCRVEISTLCNYSPVKAVLDVLIFELPDVVTQCGSFVLLIRSVGHVMAMTIPPALECTSCHSSVGFTVTVIQPSNCCPIDKAADQAVTLEGTCRPVGFRTVAGFVVVCWFCLIITH